MKLFGPLHLGLVGAIAAAAGMLVWLCRRGGFPLKTTRWALGLALAAMGIAMALYLTLVR